MSRPRNPEQARAKRDRQRANNGSQRPAGKAANGISASAATHGSNAVGRKYRAEWEERLDQEWNGRQ